MLLVLLGLILMPRATLDIKMASDQSKGGVGGTQPAGRSGSDVVKNVSQYDSPHGSGATKSDTSKGGVTGPEGYKGDVYDADRDGK